MQTHAKDDEQLVLKLISIRKILTPTANWIQEDEDAEKDEERRREQEQVVIQQKMEEERRQELLALENAKKARLRAKKIAMGLDPSVERPPVLVDVPPPIVAAIENASLELRVNAKYVQKFRWFFNGRPIESESFVAGINRSTLIIPKLTKRVVGEYFCTCENEEGTVSTPTCRVSLAVLRLSRLASKVLGTLSTSPIYACDRGMIVACVGGKLNYSDAKTLAPAKVFPALPTAMEALAWDPQTKILAAFSASKKMDEPAQVLFYSLERPAAGPSSDNSPAAPNRRRNNSILALSLKPKVPLLSTSAKFQLVNVQPIKAVTEVHAAGFVDNGKMLLVTDMMHTVAIYDLSPSFACRNIISFDRDVVCHMSASLRGPVLFSLAFRNKSFVKFYRNITINTSNNANPAEEVINFKFPVHRISFDASGFFLAVAETGFMKSWISIVNVNTKKPSSKRFIAHTGRISGLQWTTSTALLISSSLDGYVKVWDPVRMSSLMSVHVDTYGIHSMLLMEELAVLVVLGYSDCRLQSRLILQLSELEASRLVELNKQAANIQKIWKGGKTREIIAKYIRGPGT
ncbi:unnamed protein product [Phytophthora lilii]|uniref:Unnamed protein product n=1 Tax=Phytophthora lilii TaxID=2077276 RepID=A0A9W7CQ35_9STRA|nr:unnamed protein product [Phytophthora lilii]